MRRLLLQGQTSPTIASPFIPRSSLAITFIWRSTDDSGLVIHLKGFADCLHANPLLARNSQRIWHINAIGKPCKCTNQIIEASLVLDETVEIAVGRLIHPTEVNLLSNSFLGLLVPHFLPFSLQCMTSGGKFHLRDRGSTTTYRVSPMTRCHLRSLVTPDFQFVMQSISRQRGIKWSLHIRGLSPHVPVWLLKEPCPSRCTKYSHEPLLFCSRNRSTAGAVSHAICHCLQTSKKTGSSWHGKLFFFNALSTTPISPSTSRLSYKSFGGGGLARLTPFLF